MDIDFTYTRAMRSADKLDRLAKKLDRVASNSLENCESSLMSSWESENMQMFCRKSQRLRDKISREASDVLKVAETIRRVATEMKIAEERARSIAGVNG